MSGIENLREFEIGLDEFAKKEIPRTVKLVQQKVGLQLVRGVILKTPVDTGRARGNWQVSINVSINTVIDRLDRSGGAAISDGTSLVTSAEPFSVISLQNNLPYIIKLEEGHSKQAPAGMVELTLNEIMSQFT